MASRIFLAQLLLIPKKCVALKWAVAEMEERYRKMSKMGVRNIESFNLRVKEAIKIMKILHEQFKLALTKKRRTKI